MRVHRVLLSPLVDGEAKLIGAEAHHLARVLRARPGDPLVAFDGAGLEAPGTVVEVDGPRVRVRLEAPQPSPREARRRLTLATALLKGDKLSEVVRRGTELGARTFAPAATARADRAALSGNKLERLRRVATEAAKQCGRARVPEVQEAATLDAVARAARERGDRLLVAQPDEATRLAEALVEWGDRVGDHEEAGAVTVFTGPEGGFDPTELEVLGAAGAVPVGLGPRVLRAETAPVALAALLLAEVAP